MPTHVTCDRCGKEATIIFTEGLWSSDPRRRGINVVQTIECPSCGKRDQPAVFLKPK